MRRILKIGSLLVVGLGVLGTLGLFIAARMADRPANLGVKDGKLADCPATPNCVSSQSTDALHSITPLTYTTSMDQARERLLQVIQGHPRSSIIESTPTYIAAVYRSKTFAFPDDVEFVFDDASKQIHVRSASRLGRGDSGVNRARVEDIRQRFEQVK